MAQEIIGSGGARMLAVVRGELSHLMNNRSAKYAELLMFD